VGGGIGIMALMAKEMGVFKDITGDISEYMLEQGRNKALSIRYNSDRIEFRQLDAEALTFKESQERKRYK
jgi:ubiquinone/menaquinone biosynthesis C-methylase UbiE